MIVDKNKLGKSFFLARRTVYMSIEQIVIVLLGYAILSIVPGNLGQENAVNQVNL